VSRRVVVGSLIPCLWGKLQNISFSKVSKQVVMSFCVAGVALCDIPTCLITCRKFCCAHVSRLESLVSRHVAVSMGEAAKPPFRKFPSRLSCRFAWQAWHFVTFQPVFYRVEISLQPGTRMLTGMLMVRSGKCRVWSVEWKV